MSSTITEKTVAIEVVSLDEVLRQHPREQVQVNLSVSLSENPAQWTFKVTGTAANGSKMLMHKATYDPAQISTPYQDLGELFGVDDSHGLYSAMRLGRTFSVENFTDWVTEAQLQLMMRGIEAHVDMDVHDTAEAFAPKIAYSGVPPY